MKQLHDSDYLVVSQRQDTVADGWDIGHLIKLNKAGEIVWQNDYLITRLENNYPRDARERADGSIVFTGSSFNSAEPNTFRQDMWLVSVDSNGCPVPGCYPNGVASPLPSAWWLHVWPNPTVGNFTVELPDGQSQGEMTVYNIQGQAVAAYKVHSGINDLNLPRAISEGVYVCRYVPDSGNAPVVVRLVYRP